MLAACPISRKGFTLLELIIAIGISAGIMLSFNYVYETLFGGASRNQQIVTSHEEAFLESTVVSGLLQQGRALVFPASGNLNGTAVLLQNRREASAPFYFLSSTSVSVNHNGNVSAERRLAIRYLTHLPGVALDNASGFSVDTPHHQIIGPGGLILNTLGVPRHGDDTITAAGETKLQYPTQLVAGPAGTYFFTDTGNHKVKKLTNSNGNWTVRTVLGFDTAASDCNANANATFNTHVCQLSFPTGLWYDSGSNALYVADSGNGRIVKITNPTNTSTNPLTVSFKIPFDLGIHQIHFDFPVGMTLPVGLTNATKINPGILTPTGTGSSLNYQLFSPLSAPAPVVVRQGNVNAPNNKITLQSITPFRVGDALAINSNTNSYLVIATEPETNTLTLNAPLLRDYAAGEEASLLSANTRGDVVQIQFAGDLGQPSPTVSPVLRLMITGTNGEISMLAQPIARSDNELGTDDDTMTIVATGLQYPTQITSPTSFIQELSNPASIRLRDLNDQFNFTGSLALADATYPAFTYDGTSHLLTFQMKFVAWIQDQNFYKGFTNSAILPLYPFP